MGRSRALVLLGLLVALCGGCADYRDGYYDDGWRYSAGYYGDDSWRYRSGYYYPYGNYYYYSPYGDYGGYSHYPRRVRVDHYYHDDRHHDHNHYDRPQANYRPRPLVIPGAHSGGRSQHFTGSRPAAPGYSRPASRVPSSNRSQVWGARPGASPSRPMPRAGSSQRSQHFGPARSAGSSRGAVFGPGRGR